ncbi:glycosyltransferase [bacterium]|nr:glycosyltransferase [bacterium]
MKRICLIIPVYNAYNATKKCLNSVLRNFDFTIGEVVIVDDCSSKKTASFLHKFTQKYPTKLKLIKNEENQGWLISCNKAAAETNADIVVFLNSDTEISSDFCSKIINCFKSDEKIVVASPVSSNSARYFIPQVLPKKIMNIFFDKHEPVYPNIDNAEGFCFCVRNTFIKQYGLFDSIYGLGYCEEVDFCYKAYNLGFRCVLIDNLYVLHQRHKSFGKMRDKLLSQNSKIFYKKWGDYISDNVEGSIYNPNPVKLIFGKNFSFFSKLLTFLIKARNVFRNGRLLELGRLTSLQIKFMLQSIKRASKRRVVYTCISGDCDIVPIIQNYYNPDWDYVCFTDNKTLNRLKRFAMWKIRPLKFDGLDSTRNARWHKTHPSELFPDYDESVWIDGNINILTNYLFLKIEQSNKDMLIPIHYCRSCVYKEANVVKKLKRDCPEIVNKYLSLIENDNFPKNYGLNETNIIYRRHNVPAIINVMNEWWRIIENHSKRDQLSLSYVLWKNDIKIDDISIENARIDYENFKMYTHNKFESGAGKILSFLFR